MHLPGSLNEGHNWEVHFKCGSCGCKDIMMADLPHALQKPWRSLVDIQDLILAGKFGNTPDQFKPLVKGGVKSEKYHQ